MDTTRSEAIEHVLKTGRYVSFSQVARHFGVTRQHVSILAMKVGAPTPVRGALIWRACKYCGKEYGRTRWQHKSPFCSRACFEKMNRAFLRLVFCAQCGKMLQRSDRQLRHAKSGLSFCNPKCRYAYFTPHLLVKGWEKRGLV